MLIPVKHERWISPYCFAAKVIPRVSPSQNSHRKKNKKQTLFVFLSGRVDLTSMTAALTTCPAPRQAGRDRFLEIKPAAAQRKMSKSLLSLLTLVNDAGYCCYCFCPVPPRRFDFNPASPAWLIYNLDVNNSNIGDAEQRLPLMASSAEWYLTKHTPPPVGCFSSLLPHMHVEKICSSLAAEVN